MAMDILGLAIPALTATLYNPVLLEQKCPAATVPTIEFVLNKQPIQLDFRRGINQLGSVEIDSPTVYKPDESHVGGLTATDMSVSNSVEYEFLESQWNKSVCLRINKIALTLDMSQTVFVATDFPQGTCAHNAILEHEQKHVAVDDTVVAEFQAVYASELNRYVQNIGFIGPVQSSIAEQTKQKLLKEVTAITDGVTQKMFAEWRERQKAVDTKQEYERVSALCEDPPKREPWQRRPSQ